MFRLQQYPIPSSRRPERTACRAELPPPWICAPSCLKETRKLLRIGYFNHRLASKDNAPLTCCPPAVKRSETYQAGGARCSGLDPLRLNIPSSSVFTGLDLAGACSISAPTNCLTNTAGRFLALHRASWLPLPCLALRPVIARQHHAYCLLSAP